MEQCNCKYTWEYQDYLNEMEGFTVEERLVHTVLRPFFGEKFEEVCESCQRAEGIANREMDEMDAIVAASNLPEAQFDWRDPVAGDFRSVHLAFQELRKFFIGEFTKTGEMVSQAYTRKIIAHWAGIDDPEDLIRILDIGMWVDEAFTVAVMDYDEMDEYYRELRGEDDGAMDREAMREAANDAFNFIRSRMMQKANEDLIIRELEKEFNED